MTLRIMLFIALAFGSVPSFAQQALTSTEQRPAADKTRMAGQDPTAPLGWDKPAKSTSTAKRTVTYRLPTLKSIACDEVGRCNAVLNNSVVEKGDKLNGYQVRQISDENVTLVRGSKLWTLELFSLDIKN